MSNQPQPFRAAVVQTLAVLGNIEANLGIVREHVAEAVRQGARLVVLPECMNSGYLFDSPEHAREVAEPVDGRFVQGLAALCREHDIYIATGFTEWDAAADKVFNTALLLDPAGELILHYHKQFLATHDQNWFSFGERGCPVVDTELGRLGLLICFDGRIPEIARSLALQGADVILDMANFFAMDQADQWVPARAYENGVWFVAATKAGVERSIYYPGGSMIVAPDGSTRAYVEYDTHGVASAEVDPGMARRKGWQFSGDRFADRVPAAYGILGRDFEDTPAAALLKQPLVPEASTTKAAAVQAHLTADEPGVDAVAQAVEHTALLGAKVIALPQHAVCASWLPDRSEAGEAVPAAEALLARLQAVASHYACAVVVPVFTDTGDGFAQEAVVIGPDGEIGRQRQVHVEPELRDWCVAGEGFTVFDTPFGRLGVLLGYDGQFPESARVLALQGADLIVWATAWREGKDRRLLAVPKAEDNRCFLLCVNRSDAPYPGGSFLVPPTGFPHWDVDVAAPPTRRHGAVMPGFVNLALARQKSMIPKVDMLRNRLVQHYAPITGDADKPVAAPLGVVS